MSKPQKLKPNNEIAIAQGMRRASSLRRLIDTSRKIVNQSFWMFGFPKNLLNQLLDDMDAELSKIEMTFDLVDYVIVTPKNYQLTTPKTIIPIN